MKAKHAILIPAYNARSTIVETLHSIMAQSPVGIQAIERVVLADDASKDDTVSVAAQAWSHPTMPLEVWQYDQNRGERTTVNSSFRRLLDEGTSIAWVLHADDVAKPHWLETMLSAITSSSDQPVSVCSSWDDWQPPSKIVPGEDRPEAPPVVISGTPEAAVGTLKAGCWWHFSGCAMHLPSFFEVGEFRTDMPQLGDIEWLIRASMAGKTVVYLPRTLIKYRAHSGSVSTVSFRTNRDLREALLIYELNHSTTSLSVEANNYAKRYAKLAARRAATCVLRGRWSMAVDSAKWCARIVRSLAQAKEA